MLEARHVTATAPLVQIMVVPNALEDSRFENNKFVKELGVRFYCGTPLVSSEGHRLGTL